MCGLCVCVCVCACACVCVCVCVFVCVVCVYECWGVRRASMHGCGGVALHVTIQPSARPAYCATSQPATRPSPKTIYIRPK